MIINTITCHDVYNTGASLQAYALYSYLKSLGHEVKIIDYKPIYLQKYSFRKVPNPRFDKPVLKQLYLVLKLPERIKGHLSKSKKAFDNFTNKYLEVTEKTYYKYEDLKKNPPQADLYIAGSDQIWNTLFQNGKDPSFYLQFAPKGTTKASYAASFATETVVDEYKNKVKNWISSLDCISVREKSGLDILGNFGITRGRLVLDPVFLLSSDEWKKLVGKRPVKEKYIFIYDFDQNEKIAKFARKLAEKKHWKVISFLDNPWADQTFQEEGPEMFLSLIEHAEYIVSNSFHATVFSLIFNKPFAVFDRNEHINTRMNDLMALVGLTKRNDQIDYERVNNVLSAAIKESKDYLDSVIKVAEKSVR